MLKSEKFNKIITFLPSPFDVYIEHILVLCSDVFKLIEPFPSE